MTEKKTEKLKKVYSILIIFIFYERINIFYLRFFILDLSYCVRARVCVCSFIHNNSLREMYI